MHSIANLRSVPLSLSIVSSSSSSNPSEFTPLSASPLCFEIPAHMIVFQSKSSFGCYGTDGKSEPKQVKLRDDWRERSRPIPPGGTYPAKDHCRFNLSFTVLAGRAGSLIEGFLFSSFLSFIFGFFPCSRCGLCDTYYVAHVKNACAFLGDGMSRIEVSPHSFYLYVFLVFLYPNFSDISLHNVR